jgi:hypothetical protein
MVLKNIGSGIARLAPTKLHKHVRVDVGSDRHRAEATIRRGQNCKRFIPKVVKGGNEDGTSRQVM